GLRYEERPSGSRLVAATHAGYVRVPDGYRERALPPVELTYSEAVLDPTVRTVATESLVNLPAGGAADAWVDLDGAGVAGVLSEAGGTWHYKKNLSPVGPDVRLGPQRLVGTLPATAPGESWQWIDTAGDGQPDLV